MWYIIISLTLGLLFGFLYRSLLKLFKAKVINIRAKNNIGKFDRAIRYLFALVLLYFGLINQSNTLLFFSGFCFFEAIFSWCGFYALLGRNTCEI